MKNKLFFDKLIVMAFLCCATLGLDSYAQIVTFDAKTTNQSVNLSNGATHEETITITNKGNAPLSWSVREVIVGTPIYINKPDYADGTQKQYQDVISENVILARRENQNIFNIAKELGWSYDTSPALTFWLEGESRGQDVEDYTNLNEANDWCGSCILDNTYSMYIPTERRFFDFEFTRFTNSGRGGFEYTRREIVTWAETSKMSGDLSPNQSEEMVLTLSPQNLLDGEYLVNVEFITNDTQASGNILVPLVVKITGGVPEIDTESSISLQNQMIGGSSTTMLQISNTGTAPLNINGITSSSSLVTFGKTTLTVGVDEVEEVKVFYSPETTDVTTGEITISSNDTSSPNVISFTGQGLEAPKLVVSTDIINGTLGYGNAMTASLKIENTGTVDLLLSKRAEVSGSRISFTKVSYSDFNDPSNQDRITPSVALARKNQQGLYNPVAESTYDDYAPAGTVWSNKKTTSSSDSDYRTFRSEFGGNPTSFIGETISMKSIAEDRYFDFIFSYWAEGNGNGAGSGGGFSYERYEVPKWLSVRSLPSALSAGSSMTLTFDIEANVTRGVYQADFVFETNDPVNPEIKIPFQIEVTGGAPEVSLPSATYDFGETLIGETSKHKIAINNVGSDTLFLSNVSSDNSQFRISSYDSYISDNKTGYIVVEHAPSAEEIASAQISFQTSDKNNSNLGVSVTGKGTTSPSISVTYDPIIINKDAEQPFSQEIFIENTAGVDLEWTLSGNNMSSIEDALSGINAKHNLILNEMSSMTVFRYDGGSNYISDGYSDMYDGGNYLATNYFRGIDYSDNEIVDGSNYFGEGTKYYTRHYNGLFFLDAELNGVEEFEIYGNLGADGSGSVDTLSLERKIQGKTYKAFVKRVYGTSDPAIHHMIIVENSESLSREYSKDTDNDFHKVSGLKNHDRLYYLLYARNSRTPYTTDQLDNIFETALISLTRFPMGIDLSVFTGSVSNGYSNSVTISSDDPSAIESGISDFVLHLNSNDIENGEIEIPVTIQGSPKIALSESSLNYGTQYIGYPKTHHFAVQNVGVEPLSISNIAVNNPAFVLSAENTTIPSGETYNISLTYNPTTSGEHVGGISFTTNDVNNPSVSIYVEGDAEVAPMMTSSIDFTYLDIYPGATHVGQVALSNTQGVDLEWSVVLLNENGENVSPYYISMDKTAGSLASGSSEVIDIEFNASSLSSLNENYVLEITSNDPAKGVVQHPFRFRVNEVIAMKTLDNVIINQDVASGSIDISSLFQNENNETISYLVVSSDVNILTVDLEGNTLKYYPQSHGTVKVSIAATIDGSNYAYSDFYVRVNGIIVEANPIAAQVVTEGFGSKVIDFTSLFSEPDNDKITYSVALSADNVVSYTLNGTKLTLSEKGIGKVTVTITAKEELHSLSSAFTFEVKEKEKEITALEMNKEVWSIFPNPTSNSFKINSQSLGDLQIYSTSGYLVKEVKIERVGQSINVQGLSSGLYIISFNNQKSKLIIR